MIAGLGFSILKRDGAFIAQCNYRGFPYSFNPSESVIQTTVITDHDDEGVEYTYETYAPKNINQFEGICFETFEALAETEEYIEWCITGVVQYNLSDFTFVKQEEIIQNKFMWQYSKYSNGVFLEIYSDMLTLVLVVKSFIASLPQETFEVAIFSLINQEVFPVQDRYVSGDKKQYVYGLIDKYGIAQLQFFAELHTMPDNKILILHKEGL